MEIGTQAGSLAASTTVVLQGDISRRFDVFRCDISVKAASLALLCGVRPSVFEFKKLSGDPEGITLAELF